MQEQEPLREAQQRRQLRRHRTIATGFLLLAAALFAGTYLVPEPGFWVLLLRAGSEAGVIGGLADWFAVTALFRHPFGIPIPHTAIIPRNKDRIGGGLGSFVERHFLVPEVVRERLEQTNMAGRIGRWLSDGEHSRQAADQLVELMPEVLRSFDDQEVRAFFRDTFAERLESADPLPLLRKLLGLLLESRQHQQLFDRALLVAHRALVNNKGLIYQRVAERSAWWVPSRVDRKLAEAIVAAVEELLVELTEHGHPARRRFDAAVAELVGRMEHSQSLRERVRDYQRQLLASPEVATALGSLWDELRRLLQAELEAPESSVRSSLARSLQALGHTLVEDEPAQQRLNRRLQATISGLVVPFRAEIGHLIRDVVASWDSRTVSRRLELEVGRDLQYIRINGTLVGALAGCLLFLLTHAL